MSVARITYEFLGPVAAGAAGGRRVAPAARAPLPARRGGAAGGGTRRSCARAPCVCAGGRRAAAGGPRRRGASVRGPDAAAALAVPGRSGGGRVHRTGMDIRFAGGTDYGTGPALALVPARRAAGRRGAPDGLQRAVAAADFGNGVSRVLDFDRHLFVNTDLTVHLHREPAGEWILIDARTVVDPSGLGLATVAPFRRARRGAWAWARRVCSSRRADSVAHRARDGQLAAVARLDAADQPVTDDVDPPVLDGGPSSGRAGDAQRADEQHPAIVEQFEGERVGLGEMPSRRSRRAARAGPRCRGWTAPRRAAAPTRRPDAMSVIPVSMSRSRVASQGAHERDRVRRVWVAGGHAAEPTPPARG